MASVRAKRQQALREIVQGSELKTQAELVDELAERGFAVTQTTVSRDIADIGLVKNAQGVYVLAQDHRLRTMMASAVRETRRAENQVLVLTDPGSASSVAAALDAAQPAGMLGCIAGDDTILVICENAAAGKRFAEEVDALLGA